METGQIVALCMLCFIGGALAMLIGLLLLPDPEQKEEPKTAPQPTVIRMTPVEPPAPAAEEEPPEVAPPESQPEQEVTSAACQPIDPPAKKRRGMSK